MINSSTLRRMVHSHVDCARACSVFLFLPTRRAGLFFFFQAEDGIRDKLVTGVQTCAFFFQAEDGIRDKLVTGVQTCALPISSRCPTCGGSKLPPKRAISGIEEKPQPIPREGVALRVPESAELRRRCALVGPGPERGAAGEQIDGRFVVDELVLLRTPAELRRILGAGVDDGGNAETD